MTTDEIQSKQQEEYFNEKYGEQYSSEYLEFQNSQYHNKEEELSIQMILFSLAIPIPKIFGIFYISFCILVGFEIFGNKERIEYGQILKASIFAHLIFVCQRLIHYSHMIFFMEDYSLDYISKAKPLSLNAVLFDVNYPEWLSNFTPLFDIFEILFVLALLKLLRIITERPIVGGLKIVGISYLISILLITVAQYFIIQVT